MVKQLSFEFTAQNEDSFKEILGKYPEDHQMAALIPTLYLAQSQNGYVSIEVMRYVAERLSVPPSQVLNTATFYTLLRKEPRGRFHIQVCSNVSCYLRGSDQLLSLIREECGVAPGEVSTDRLFSCEEVQCLASCGTAPAVQVNWDYHENQTPESLSKLLKDLRGGAGHEKASGKIREEG